MLVFPQLTNGAYMQYPLVRITENRTVVNYLADGTAVKFEDVSASRTGWELRLESLNDAERVSIEQLFLATEGELGVFMLLDPTANLLGWSEDFSNPVWGVDPLIQAIGGQADPTGGTGAWQFVNSGQARQKITQSIAAPAGFDYCFSLFAKGTGSINLMRSGGAVADTRTFELTGIWQRVASAGSLATSGDTFQVGLALDAGGSVQVYGPQLEAQPAAGPYRRSVAAGGVYSSVRFESNRLDTVAVGLDRHSSIIRLVSVE